MTIEKFGTDGFPKVLEFQRRWPGVDVEKFLWLHVGCEVETKIEAVNSSEVDASSGDPKPIFKEYFVCDKHNVRSASRDALEV